MEIFCRNCKEWFKVDEGRLWYQEVTKTWYSDINYCISCGEAIDVDFDSFLKRKEEMMDYANHHFKRVVLYPFVFLMVSMVVIGLLQMLDIMIIPPTEYLHLTILSIFGSSIYVLCGSIYSQKIVKNKYLDLYNGSEIRL